MSAPRVLTPTPKNPLRRWSQRAAQKATLSRMEKAATLLAEIGVIWDDVDQYTVGVVEQHIEELRREFAALQEDWAAQPEGDAA